jgi:hypothetical protein
MAVVLCRINDEAVKMESANWCEIRNTLKKVAYDDPYATIINTDDLNDYGDFNDPHNTDEGYAEQARRLAAAVVTVTCDSGDCAYEKTYPDYENCEVFYPIP